MITAVNHEYNVRLFQEEEKDFPGFPAEVQDCMNTNSHTHRYIWQSFPKYC